jgi:hypothetical protein
MQVSKEVHDFAKLLIKHYGKQVSKFQKHEHDEHCHHDHDDQKEPEPTQETPEPTPELKQEAKDKYSLDYSKW